jgi:hypothetical protein
MTLVQDREFIIKTPGDDVKKIILIANQDGLMGKEIMTIYVTLEMEMGTKVRFVYK